MSSWHRTFPFEMVIMLGDNIYGGQQPQDFVDKFETPYKPLLDAGVKFYAALGNHDSQTSRFYKLWNMNGERYYAFAKKNVKFFVLDSDYMDPKQLQWPLTASGYDADQTLMLNEVAGDELFFQVITRTGKTIDAGVIPRQAKPKSTEAPPSQR